MGSEDSLLRADLENMYTFTHKAWNPHVVENEVPANLEHVNRNPRLYVVLNDQEDTDQANMTATAGTGKLVVSEECVHPWIANVNVVDANTYTRCSCFHLRMSLFTSPPKLVSQKLRLLP